MCNSTSIAAASEAASRKCIGNMKHIIAGIGELLWDNLPSGRCLGGAPANVAYQATALGGQGFIVSCTGNDNAGRDILGKLDELDINRDYVTIHPKRPTGKAMVKIDSFGVPDFTITENAAWDAIPMMPGLPGLARKADAVVFGTLAQRSEISRETIRAFVGASRSDALRVLDLNLRSPYYSDEVLQWALNACNVLKLNEEELQVIAGLSNTQKTMTEGLDQILGRFPINLIALTRGGKGSLLYCRKEQCAHDGYAAGIVDTVGAGDAFTAALTLGFLEGYNLQTISDYANRVAAYVCSQSGATPPIPARLRILEYLARKTGDHV